MRYYKVVSILLQYIYTRRTVIKLLVVIMGLVLKDCEGFRAGKFAVAQATSGNVFLRIVGYAQPNEMLHPITTAALVRTETNLLA